MAWIDAIEFHKQIMKFLGETLIIEVVYEVELRDGKYEVV